MAAGEPEARALIATGRVTVGGASAVNDRRLVAPGEAVEVLAPPDRYVSRSGEKLAAALARYDVPVAGLAYLDAGAATGGFTDCLLQHGAGSVVAVDVGHGHLDAALREDPRVEVLERTDVRTLPTRLGPDAVEGAVADLSFIRLATVLDPLLAVVAPGGPLVLMVKPQFEATHAEASRGRGVIRDPRVWSRVLTDTLGAARRGGATIMGVMASPRRGTRGNAEFLLVGRAPGRPVPQSPCGQWEATPLGAPAIAAAVSGAVADAAAAVDAAPAPDQEGIAPFDPEATAGSHQGTRASNPRGAPR